MKAKSERQEERIRRRRERERMNVFSRMPATYAASRAQAQRFLQYAGGLSVVEWRTLWDLHEAGPMSIRDLAQIQRTDHSLLSRALPDMKRKGYVTTRKDDNDGRQMIIELADAGRAAYLKAAPIMKKRRDALDAEFTAEEITNFVTFLDKLETFLRHPVNDILQDEQQT